MNSGYYTLQIYPRVYVNMFRVKPRATLGLIFFTVLIQNSDKQWKVLSGCLEKVALGNSLGQLFPDNHCGLSTVYTTVNHGTFSYVDLRFGESPVALVIFPSSGSGSRPGSH